MFKYVIPKYAANPVEVYALRACEEIGLDSYAVELSSRHPPDNPCMIPIFATGDYFKRTELFVCISPEKLDGLRSRLPTYAPQARFMLAIGHHSVESLSSRHEEFLQSLRTANQFYTDAAAKVNMKVADLECIISKPVMQKGW